MTLHELPDLVQGSLEWHDQRRGIVTASVVGKLITVRKLGALDFDCPACGAPANGPCRSKRNPDEPIKTLHPERTPSAQDKVTVIEPASNDESRGLTAALAAERITNYTEPTFMNDDMFRGVEDEPRAIDVYSAKYAPVTATGFMVEDKWGFRIGYSPDGLVGSNGLIEVKSRRQKKQLLTVISDQVPTENMAQLQAGLLVTGREWIDYVSYSGGMHLYVKRVYPDARWQKAIVSAVAAFEANAGQMVALYAEATEGLAPTVRVVEQEMRIA
ncbi:MAG: hypothetical protein JWP74_1723 [Marmoricola sp.]|nr:hypothetical protein [Marmoricola sp.]